MKKGEDQAFPCNTDRTFRGGISKTTYVATHLLSAMVSSVDGHIDDPEELIRKSTLMAMKLLEITED